MSNTTKTIFSIVVLAILVGLVWIYKDNKPGSLMSENTTSTESEVAPVSVSAATDAAIQADVSKLDAQMNSFSEDNTSIDKGLNDEPIAQDQI